MHSSEIITFQFGKKKRPYNYCFVFSSFLELLRGMPWGHTVSKNGLRIFFFMVATNLHINLFIKLSPPLLGMYCSDCLQQKQANQNPFLSLISRGRGPTHPYLTPTCVTSKHHLIYSLNRIKLWRHMVNMLWTQACRSQTEMSPFLKR